MICKRTGYTLIEMVIVLAIVAFLVMLCIPRGEFTRALKVRAEVETLSTLITYLHYSALATACDQELTIDVGHNTYTYHGTTRTLEGAQFGFLPNAQGPPGDAVYTLTNPVTFSGDRVVCSARGIISSGVLYLTDPKKQSMYALSVPVSSSCIRKYRFDNQWVLLQ